MPWMRGIVNAMLMATLVKPTVRWSVARWRRRARAAAPEAISVPVQRLIEAALIEELSSPVIKVTTTELPEASVVRSRRRTALIVGLILAVVATSSLATATAIRRRREARKAQVARKEWVAVPMGAPSKEPGEAVAPLP